MDLDRGGRGGEVTSILVNILLVLLGCALLIAGCTFFVWVLVRLAPMSDDEQEKPPPPRPAVED